MSTGPSQLTALAFGSKYAVTICPSDFRFAESIGGRKMHHFNT
jgi:hypothetical protein